MKVIDLSKPIADQDEMIKKCLDFLMGKGGSAIASGKHPVEEEGIFLNVSQYTTCSPEDGKWEAHREYADFQLVLEGAECIYVSDIHKMKTGDYNPESDYVPCYGESECCYVLNEKTGILLMPEDAHKPGVSVDADVSRIKKAVFKIPVNYFSI